MTAAAFEAEDLDRSDAPALQAMLAEAKLPPAEIDGDVRFLALRGSDGRIAAFAGLEVCGGDALLRSVVVNPAFRSQGCGRAVVSAALEGAAALGVSTVYLLTTTATGFFAHLGFITLSRDEAPVRIARTSEFASVCPASAVCMRKAVQVRP